jgi:hypothetical protein
MDIKKKNKISKKDIEQLKPITFESKGASKKTEDKPLDDEDDFLEEEQVQQRASRLNSPVLPFRAPILEKTNVPENLESEISNIQITAPQVTGTHKELTYVQNIPKYSGADYSTRTTSEMAESRDTRQDREVNISRAREFTATAASPQNRAINMGLWQRDNVFNRPDMSQEDDRDYVLQAREKKDRDKLPFQ